MTSSSNSTPHNPVLQLRLDLLDDSRDNDLRKDYLIKSYRDKSSNDRNTENGPPRPAPPENGWRYKTEGSIAEPVRYFLFMNKEYVNNADRFIPNNELVGRERATWYQYGLKGLDVIIAITHVWETTEDPDIYQAQWRNFLAIMDQLTLDKKPIAQLNYGIFYDFTSLFQKKKGDIKEEYNPTADFDVEEARVIAPIMLHSMYDLYSGQLTPTKVVDVNATGLCLYRSWPCFEISLATIYGTMNELVFSPRAIRFMNLFRGYNVSPSFKTFYELRDSSSLYRDLGLVTWILETESLAFDHILTEPRKYYGIGTLAWKPLYRGGFMGTGTVRISTFNHTAAAMSIFKSIAKERREYIVKDFADVRDNHRYGLRPLDDETLKIVCEAVFHCFRMDILETVVTCGADRDKILSQIHNNREALLIPIWGYLKGG